MFLGLIFVILWSLSHMFVLWMRQHHCSLFLNDCMMTPPHNLTITWAGVWRTGSQQTGCGTLFFTTARASGTQIGTADLGSYLRPEWTVLRYEIPYILKGSTCQGHNHDLFIVWWHLQLSYVFWALKIEARMRKCFCIFWLSDLGAFSVIFLSNISHHSFLCKVLWFETSIWYDSLTLRELASQWHQWHQQLLYAAVFPARLWYGKPLRRGRAVNVQFTSGPGKDAVQQSPDVLSLLKQTKPLYSDTRGDAPSGQWF
jgi:hypothetical protein